MDIAQSLRAIKPKARSSPLPGFEYVRGYGVFALPFDSGHVLTLRVFLENDFASYHTVWHRTPEGIWSIYADTPRLDIACPRYYSSAAQCNTHARISLIWTGPKNMLIEMEAPDAPSLQWNFTIATTPAIKRANAISQASPERLWRKPVMLRTFEQLGDKFFDLGDIILSGNAPNGHFAIVMPRRMFPIVSATAILDGVDLGQPTRCNENPAIGELRLPARPMFAVGRAYFEIKDPEEYQRTVSAIRSNTTHFAHPR